MKTTKSPGSASDTPCLVAPHPKVAKQIRERSEELRMKGPFGLADSMQLSSDLGLPIIEPGRIGFNDGSFYPPATGPAGLGMASAAAPVAPPSTGKRHVLVLLVDFPDVKGKQTSQHFDDLLFGKGTATAPTLKTYYDQASSGQLKVTGKVVGWLRLPSKLKAYTAGQSATGTYPNNGQKLVEDAIDAAVAAGVNFSKFDLDGDGSLDGLIVVHAGSGAEAETSAAKRPNLIWSHKWAISAARKRNGVTIWSYTLQPEDGRVGVFCHEFGHFLGLPDLYDTTNRSEGVGEWCLMGAGSWGGKGDRPTHMSAWCRLQLGWSKVTAINGKKVAQKLAPAHTNGPILKLGMSGGPANECFLLECRQKAGIDAALPGEGLLVWHIDDGVHGNTNPLRYQVGLVQADGKRDLEFMANRGDAGDPFPGSAGSKAFDDTSSPSSRTYAGQQSGVGVRNIAVAANGSAQADVEAP